MAPIIGYSRKFSGGAAYAGPGDIVGSALGWWGLRAYSLATAGNSAVRLVRASDSAQQTFTTLANGNLDVASITTFLAATTGKVVTLFDQSGAGLDLTQGTDANRPAFTLNAVGSLPAITFAAAGANNLVHAGSPTNSLPTTFSAVAKQSSAVNGEILSFSTHSNTVFFGVVAAPAIELYAGAHGNVASSLNTWYAIQAILNGASSILYVNGSSNTVNSGGASLSDALNSIQMGTDIFSQSFDGLIGEAGIWASGFSSGNQSAMNSNQRTYWGI